MAYTDSLLNLYKSLTLTRSHALRGNADGTFHVPCVLFSGHGTQSVRKAFPRKAWERVKYNFNGESVLFL